MSRLTSVIVADGEVVWSWRPDAGAKLCGSFREVTVAKKPGHRGEYEVSRKPLRRESRDASAEPVCSCAFSYVHFAHETAGAARTRLSLRPLRLRGPKVMQTSDASRRENANAHSRRRLKFGAEPSPSLRGAKRRSNPFHGLLRHGLLRFIVAGGPTYRVFQKSTTRCAVDGIRREKFTRATSRSAGDGARFGPDLSRISARTVAHSRPMVLPAIRIGS